MTVGISLTNGDVAYVITDSRVSTSSGRQSDSVNKMGEFKNKNYHGVIYGTGDANDVLSILKNLSPAESSSKKLSSLEDLVQNIRHSYRKDAVEARKRYLAIARDEIETKAIILPEKDREEFVQGQTAKALEDYEKAKKDQEGTGFMVVGYDKTKKNGSRIRQFGIGINGYRENFSDHAEIGSGSDGANIYLFSKLQGIDIKTLNPEDVLFFVLNAYSLSTINQGVGGKPKIAQIEKKDRLILPKEKTLALVNLSGAYMAECSTSLTNQNTRRLMKSILGRANPNYRKLAKEAGLSLDQLIGGYIPYPSWQEEANSRLFGGI